MTQLPEKKTYRETNPSAYCIHDRQKYECIKCKGSSLCEHDKPKRQCIKCGTGSKVCNLCCMSRKNYKYSNEYCLPCYKSLHPNSYVAMRSPVRKQDLVDILYDRMFPDFHWDGRDIVINDSCNRRRPDCYIDCLTHTIILEIDENQHRHYNPQCEEARVNELFAGLADRPLIFIRLNVDTYKIGNKKHKGCFKTMKSGLKADKVELKKRIFEAHLLVDKLLNFENVLEELNGDLVKQIYLYYNN